MISSRCRAAYQFGLCLLVCGSVLGVNAASSAAAPAPALQIEQVTTPTNLVPGSKPQDTNGGAREHAPKVHITITNVGGAPTSELSVSDTLPDALQPVAEPEPRIYYAGPEVEEWSPCSIAGQSVSCAFFGSLRPGESLDVYIDFEVAADAPAAVSNEVTVSGPGVSAASDSMTAVVSSELPEFNFLTDTPGLSASVFNEAGGTPAAGEHPFSAVFVARIPNRDSGGGLLPVEPLRRVGFELPPGLVFNPRGTTSRCTAAELEGEKNFPSVSCPPESQVGIASFSVLGDQLENVRVPIYNMVPPEGVPAELAFPIVGLFAHVRGGLDGGFRLTAGSTEILSRFELNGVKTEIWGNPSDSRHDWTRFGQGCPQGECSVVPSQVPLLTMPSACSTSLDIGASVASWLGSIASEHRLVSGASGDPQGVSGCGRLAFAPSVSLSPASHTAESPTGLDLQLELPQNNGVVTPATATLKKVVVSLPKGMAVNPSAANGLNACGPGEIGIGNSLPASCPEASKVGTAEIVTPLLEKPLRGSIYLARQGENPFQTLLALYLVVEGEGIVIKLPGRVDADPSTGQLTTTFDNNPQLPFTQLRVQLNGGDGGPRAPLVTPATCGDYSIRTEMTSWASPTPVVSESKFAVDKGCDGGPFHPGVSAGTINPAAGRFSAFALRITRNDREQNIARVDTALPQGLLAKLAGVPPCASAQASSGDCPTASRVGQTTVGAGAGSQPLFIPQPGRRPTAVFLSGPYKGAPYSLSIEVPAEAGPFDLGTVNVRVALFVNPFTSQVTATSDPLPQILEGIPVAYRDLRVDIDREQFILNPTSCEPMGIESTLTSSAGATSTSTNRFQVGSCGQLGFKPKLSVKLTGSPKRVGHPALKAVVTYPKQGAYANIARAQVNLPGSEFLDQSNLNRTCTKPTLLQGNCPVTSIYGKAKAWTPLLDQPVEGPVYLVGGFGYELPALVADLNGQIRILLVGKIDSGPNKGIRTTFEGVPDAPVSRFVLEMRGGPKYGLLVNSENLCRGDQKARARFTAHNGAVYSSNVPVANSCKGKTKRGKRQR